LSIEKALVAVVEKQRRLLKQAVIRNFDDETVARGAGKLNAERRVLEEKLASAREEPPACDSAALSAALPERLGRSQVD
jgi:hypothetical protein